MENGHGWPFVGVRLSQNLVRWPQFCCFCHRKTDTGYDLCRYCRPHLPAITQISGPNGPSSVCLSCGFQWPDSTERQVCAACANNQTHFRRLVCPFRYHFPIDGMIGRLKYGGKLSMGRLLGCLLADEVRKAMVCRHYPDVLMPVPLNATRFRSRGFNHAAEIAHWCGKSLNIDVLQSAAGRRLDTGSLAGLSRAERSLQIRGAFWADPALSGLSVAIIDDVLTTGATSGELATELLDFGVHSVQLWVVARTAVSARSGTS